MPWRLEGNAPIEFPCGKFNHAIFSSHSEIQEIKALAKMCDGTKILLQHLDILDLERSPPVVSELLWLTNANDALRRIYRTHAIFQTIVAHERRQQLTRLRFKAFPIIFCIGRIGVGPNTIGALILMH